jgi:hypothetical protein
MTHAKQELVTCLKILIADTESPQGEIRYGLETASGTTGKRRSSKKRRIGSRKLEGEGLLILNPGLQKECFEEEQQARSS